MFRVLVIVFIFLSSAAYADRKENDTKCINWMIEQFPELRGKIKYIPEHKLLIETLQKSNGAVSIIHTQKGSVASVPFASQMYCEIGREVFDGKTVRGLSGFLNLALAKKTSGLYKEGEGAFQSIRFLQSMPIACLHTSYPRLTSNVKAVCDNLGETPLATSLLSLSSGVCEASLK